MVSLSAGQAGGGDGGGSQSAQSQGQRNTHQQVHSCGFLGLLGQTAVVLWFSGMQAEAQCEQLSRELLRHRQQAEREAHTLKERLAQAREEGRSEAHKQKEELARTVSRPLL